MRFSGHSKVLAAGVLLLLLACAAQERTEYPEIKVKEAGEPLSIAVIPKGTTHEFWKSIHAGAVKAEREIQGLSISWQGPLKEDDRIYQIDVVENFINKKSDAIVLAPLDDEVLAEPAHKARMAGIPVVIIDSGLRPFRGKFVPQSSFVATDNTAGGRKAGERIAELLPEGGKVILLRYQLGSASTENREKGFLEVVSANPNLEIISKDQYAGATVGEALEKAESLLDRFGGEVDGIFCPNESSTQGMLEALRAKGMAGKVKFVGFDASAKLVEALRTGELHGLVVQNPFRMGYEGVKTAVSVLRGEPVEERIDTGVVLVTKENMEGPEIQALLNPPLAEYLGER
jgi:ribose transport system substrate-binding protein